MQEFSENYTYDLGNNLIEKKQTDAAPITYPIAEHSNRLKNMKYDDAGNQIILSFV